MSTKSYRPKLENGIPEEIEQRLPENSWVEDGMLKTSSKHEWRKTNSQTSNLTERKKEILLTKKENPVYDSNKVAEVIDTSNTYVKVTLADFHFLMTDDVLFDFFVRGEKITIGEEDEEAGPEITVDEYQNNVEDLVAKIGGQQEEEEEPAEEATETDGEEDEEDEDETEDEEDEEVVQSYVEVTEDHVQEEEVGFLSGFDEEEEFQLIRSLILAENDELARKVIDRLRE